MRLANTPDGRRLEVCRRIDAAPDRVWTPLGVWLPFRVRSCTGRRWTWDVAGVPATGHRVEPLGAGSLAVGDE